MSRPLTRQQLTRWRENWSFADVELIAHALDLLPEQDYYEPPSAAYVAARVGGLIAVYIAPGYLFWPKGKWSVDLDPRLIPGGLTPEDNGASYALSTFVEREDSKPAFEELTAPCPVCFLVPSVSGTCGCD